VEPASHLWVMSPTCDYHTAAAMFSLLRFATVWPFTFNVQFIGIHPKEFIKCKGTSLFWIYQIFSKLFSYFNVY
jgi:hypothetical protein